MRGNPLRYLLVAWLVLPLTVFGASLRVVSDDNYPPYIFRNPAGQAEGYLVDLWKLWEEKTGVKVELTATTWAAAQRLLLAGEADVIDLIYRTPAREPLYEFSASYADLPVVIYAHASISGIHGPDSLKGFEVGVQEGDACIDQLNKNGVSALRFFRNYEEMIEAMLAGEVKIFCMDEFPANYYLYRFDSHKQILKAFELYHGQPHRAVRKDKAATLATVEQGMALITEAEREALRKKWMGQPVSFTPYAKFFGMAFLIGSAIGLVLLLWVRSLSKLVRRRTATLQASQESLEKERQHLQNVIDGTSAGVWEWNVQTGEVTINSRWAEIIGYRLEEIEPHTIESVVKHTHPDDRIHAEAIVQEVFDRKRPSYESEIRVKHKNGEWIWVLDRAKVTSWTEDGKPLWMSGIRLDITSRKRAELALRENESRLARVIEGSSQGFWDWNLATNTFTVSDRFETMLGYEPGELQLSPENWALCVHPDDLAAAWVSIERHLAGQTPTHELEIRMRSKSGDWRWIFTRGRIVERDVEGKPLMMSGTHTDISDSKAAAEKIEILAFYDPLTLLPNRRLMFDRLRQVIADCGRSKQQGALILLDLDNFKILNDTLGHEAGDQVLVEVAARLQAIVRKDDTVARLGGDEFVIILKWLDPAEVAALQTERVIAKIQAELGRPYVLSIREEGGAMKPQHYQCVSSIGVTLFHDDSVAADELMKRADAAMYQAKAAGRNTWCFFDPQMQAMVAARAAMEVDIRTAIEEQQFLLYYQPQVDSSGRLVGVEALIRWQHPRRGPVSPAEFIPLAEETGLIVPLGHWVLETACQQLAAWAKRPETSHLTVAVNVSARQFSLPDIGERILALLDSSGAPADGLKLELTESMLLDNAETVIEKMVFLSGRGVRFSLDDFGTGYSSLSDLKRLPLHQLKIDQSFVRDVLRDPNDAAIARTIVTLGQSLGLRVIAEGVETAEQRDFLARNGCFTYQGYFYSRPLPLADFENLLQRLEQLQKEWAYVQS